MNKNYLKLLNIDYQKYFKKDKIKTKIETKNYDSFHIFELYNHKKHIVKGNLH